MLPLTWLIVALGRFVTTTSCGEVEPGESSGYHSHDHKRYDERAGCGWRLKAAAGWGPRRPARAFIVVRASRAASPARKVAHSLLILRSNREQPYRSP